MDVVGRVAALQGDTTLGHSHLWLFIHGTLLLGTGCTGGFDFGAGPGGTDPELTAVVEDLQARLDAVESQLSAAPSPSYSDDDAVAAVESDARFPRATSHAFTLRAASAGWTATVRERGVWLNGSRVQETGPGYGLVVVDRITGAVVANQEFDVAGDASQADALADELHGYTMDHIVVVSTFDEPSVNRLGGGLPEALERCGASGGFRSDLRYRGAYVLIGICDQGRGSGHEIIAGEFDEDPSAFADTTLLVVDGGLGVQRRPERARTQLHSVTSEVENCSFFDQSFTEICGLTLTFDVEQPSVLILSTLGSVYTRTAGASTRFVLDGQEACDGNWSCNVFNNAERWVPLGMMTQTTVAPGTHTVTVEGEAYGSSQANLLRSGLQVTVIPQ